MLDFLKNILGWGNINREELGSLDDNRVSWEPVAPRPGDILRVNYQGLLKNLGATEVYLHYGFDSWNKGLATVRMERTEDGGFQSEIPFAGNQEMNFCFKDGADHWDNNNGRNWTVHLQQY